MHRDTDNVPKSIPIQVYFTRHLYIPHSRYPLTPHLPFYPPFSPGQQPIAVVQSPRGVALQPAGTLRPGTAGLTTVMQASAAGQPVRQQIVVASGAGGAQTKQIVMGPGTAQMRPGQILQVRGRRME